ncbi:MAG: type II secretion system protein [Candidatus Zixiibacteriota bacterium]
MNSVLPKINNSRGLTLLELIVAMALTGMLLVFFISANIFIQKILINWSNDNTLAEEREFLLQVISDEVAACDYLSFDSSKMSLICYEKQDTIHIAVDGGNLLKDNNILNRYGVVVDNFEISEDVFAKVSDSSILNDRIASKHDCILYRIELSVSYKGKTDVAVQKVRNFLAYAKQ